MRLQKEFEENVQNQFSNNIKTLDTIFINYLYKNSCWKSKSVLKYKYTYSRNIIVLVVVLDNLQEMLHEIKFIKKFKEKE